MNKNTQNFFRFILFTLRLLFPFLGHRSNFEFLFFLHLWFESNATRKCFKNSKLKMEQKYLYDRYTVRDKIRLEQLFVTAFYWERSSFEMDVENGAWLYRLVVLGSLKFNFDVRLSNSWAAMCQIDYCFGGSTLCRLCRNSVFETWL